MLETAPFPPPAPLTERKRWGESLKRLLPGGGGYTVSPPYPCPAYLCWIPSPAAYRTVLASGWLHTNRQFWRLGLWSQSCSTRSCLSRPCFVTTDPPEDTRPTHTSPEVGGGHSKFWTTWAKVLSPTLSSLPTQGKQRLAGVQGSHGSHQGERFRSPEHRPQFSSCPQQGAPLGAHRRFSISSLPPGSCFPATHYRLCCICISFHAAVNPLVCHSLRPSTEPDI